MEHSELERIGLPRSPVPPPVKAFFGSRQLEALGVTRVARLTGLDRIGIEVACAVRPLGHVLQVSNGKGADFAQAWASAVSEAAELWAAERVVPEELIYGTVGGLRRLHGARLWEGDLGSGGVCLAPALWTDGMFVALRAGRDLFSGERVLLPAGALHCPPPGACPVGPLAWAWTSNGLAAHPRPAGALEHALCEVIERDQLARALPQGFTAEALAARTIAPASLPPSLAAWHTRLRAVGFQVVWIDLTPSRGLGLPVAGVLLRDRERGPVPLTAGYACRADPAAALLAALFEAAQSRLTDIHGGRDDVSPPSPGALRTLTRWIAATEGRRAFERLPRPRGRGVKPLLAALRRGGHARAAAVRLSPAGFPLTVVKVVVPSLRVSELL